MAKLTALRKPDALQQVYLAALIPLLISPISLTAFIDCQAMLRNCFITLDLLRRRYLLLASLRPGVMKTASDNQKHGDNTCLDWRLVRGQQYWRPNGSPLQRAVDYIFFLYFTVCRSRYLRMHEYLT